MTVIGLAPYYTTSGCGFVYGLPQSNPSNIFMSCRDNKNYGEIKKVKNCSMANPGCLSKIIPFPPLEEQHRIVERLDALLPLCENL